MSKGPTAKPKSKSKARPQPASQPLPPHVVVLTGDDGNIRVETRGMSEMAVPTLLRLAAVIVERKYLKED